MRVLVADPLSSEALDEIRALGAELTYEPELTGAELAGALAGVGVLVVRGTPVDAATLEAAPALTLVVRAGPGMGRIDVAAASERGVYVCNCPGRNASAVVELTLGLMLALDRRLPDAVASLGAGRWQKDEFARARGLAGRRLGIAGLGHVGRGVLRVGRELGMRLHAYSRSLTTARATELGVSRHDRLDQLAAASEVFTVHLELNERTRGVINRRVIEALPDGALFINTAREELCDYEALADLAPKKGLRVAVDGFPGEPKARTDEFQHRLLESGALVYATPHIGASTDAAQEAIGSEVARIVRSFLVEGEVPNTVNVAHATRARYQLMLRFRDKVGALANVLGVLKRHGINVQEVENTVFEGGRAGCAKVRVSHRPSEACLQEIMAFRDEVLHVHLVVLPNLA